MITIENETLLYEKYNLTPNELYCVKIILLSSEENLQYLIRFCAINEEHKAVFKSCLKSLQDKGVILKSYKIPKTGEKFVPEDVEFNKNFIKNFFRSSFEMGEELFNTYPMFGDVNGCRVGLRGVAKKFNSLEDFYKFYGKSIKYNPDKHKEIIELVSWAKENTNFINQSICSFVINQSWNELKALKDEGVITSNIKIL